VQRADSGQPGAPLEMADIARALWGDFLKRNPANPRRFARDRFRGGHRRRGGVRFERGRPARVPGVDALPKCSRRRIETYRESVLPRAVRRRVAVEADATLSWWRYVGAEGRVIGIGWFGASGRGADAMAQFGFTAGRIGREVGEPLDTVN
jgi:transketolase